MHNLDLEERYQNFIKTSIKEILPDAKIFIYGSRVKNKALKYSDVDIAVKCPTKIPFEKILKLKAYFENSTFPYQVDLIDLDDISEKFLSMIKEDLTEI